MGGLFFLKLSDLPGFSSLALFFSKNRPPQSSIVHFTFNRLYEMVFEMSFFGIISSFQLL
ncbi:hypothetical protein LEP1GSC158_0623 [Leptospira interrogans serovar Zanoni str. LT2156]|uniref:Uncharacterized protein n=1 Tax=Leptospira interrogans serovar Zanoni str. LT2156 TaxID=1001601 RepID=M6HAY8_LEPIR|nr:hypothetical protein LEP1GSC158_0623 [Leptospira interrogans serovar Zanoni str. LT2156]